LRALITGITGFAGSHLANHLLQETEWEVWGLDVREAPKGFSPRVHLRVGDLCDPQFVAASLEESRPHYVFHLAAQAFVPTSWEDPWETLANNIRGQLNLLQGVILLGLKPRILVVGSADEYGMVRPEELPIVETTPLRPYNPYAVSKVTQDMLGYQYFASHGLPIVRVRPFNHIGPGQGERFVASDFARQIAEIELGRRPPMVKVGNLEARRDFTDVRDIVRAYYLALLNGEPGEVYNIASGRAYSIREILEGLLRESEGQVEVKEEPSRYRPLDVPIVIGDCRKLKGLTGWETQISLEQTLRDILDYWRERLKEER
jgi:GDP-4-dehydro-6-deoxy-D-mannose reductase